MTREEVRARRDFLMKNLNDARNLIQHIQLDLRHLKLECKHPETYHGSAMGESFTKCADCGWG